MNGSNKYRWRRWCVMIMVSIGTFSWDSIRNLKKHPLSTNIVMVTTVVVVVATHNLAIGVGRGRTACSHVLCEQNWPLYECDIDH